MKRFVTVIGLVCILMISCGTASAPAPHTNEEEPPPLPLTPRNLSITRAHAFNDLFIDSSQVEQFIVTQGLDDTTAWRLRSFYNARNFEFAWMDSKGPTEQAAAFRSLYNYNNDTAGSKALDIRLDMLMGEDDLRVSEKDPAMIQVELQLTRRLIQYFNKRPAGVTEIEHMIPVLKYPVMQLADSMLQLPDKNYPAAVKMKPWLKIYRNYVESGGWQPVAISKNAWQKGQSSPEIIPVKKRLLLTGELTDNDTTPLFNDALEIAINRFRNSNGYTENGVLNDTVVRALNVSAAQRLQQVLVNMERIKWMPVSPAGKWILANIPAFELHVLDGEAKVFDMDIVVGKEGHSTTMFSGRLNQIVFNPYWNIPRSIVRKEILPAMQRNRNYLSARNMQVTGHVGGIPVIRQLPGRRNALGRVKFLFPNSYHIYFHDTPNKRLFNRDSRAYSHGCIRLKEPAKLAKFLLEDSPQWTHEKIDSAMNGGKQRYVTLQHPVPVIITYYTTWLDTADQLHFAADVYGHDEKIKAKLFR
ncbi:L,D-transpeptidase family protein [Chitinophaga nivalis]|uniref:L,D-transpeptidase family protein n=1 Tax=Chitinophaga nivalis TaxID=2991709 RepID=A0ABT3IGA2_9BACT|nr:L,D-transpeptidase family protein [Chitinophaga nivalis]MCW3467347.1 L,D-transpeptidase family protein [Chitinophaga nivalis]MCW3482961.1 L,D-transpeptidase family protein [Chitinophaga nivalis]